MCNHFTKRRKGCFNNNLPSFQIHWIVFDDTILLSDNSVSSKLKSQRQPISIYRCWCTCTPLCFLVMDWCLSQADANITARIFIQFPSTTVRVGFGRNSVSLPTIYVFYSARWSGFQELHSVRRIKRFWREWPTMQRKHSVVLADDDVVYHLLSCV